MPEHLSGAWVKFYVQLLQLAIRSQCGYLAAVNIDISKIYITVDNGSIITVEVNIFGILEMERIEVQSENKIIKITVNLAQKCSSFQKAFRELWNRKTETKYFITSTLAISSVGFWRFGFVCLFFSFYLFILQAFKLLLI